MKYKCVICGFVYDEATGHKESDIKPYTKWKDIPEDWLCPVCGASKEEFEPEKTENQINKNKKNINFEEKSKELSYFELSVICSNYAKGCEKQYLSEEAELFQKMSQYYKAKSPKIKEKSFNDIADLVKDDINSKFSIVTDISKEEKDRGALRAVVWNEKTTRMINSLMKKYEKEGDKFLNNNRIYVCEICGFIYLGNNLPDVCPVCKVPKTKINEVRRA